MDYVKYPKARLDGYMHAVDSARLDPTVYRELGVSVLRNVIPAEDVGRWIDEWKRFQGDALAKGRKLDPYNQVVLHEPVPKVLSEIYRHPAILDIMEVLYPNLGLFVQRFVIKDVHNRDPVFLHQDYCYNLGWPDKTSVFVPLSPMNSSNGGLVLYPGTHRLGYLGDAGEIDLAILDPEWPTLAPSIDPGDVVLMHDCMWHSSPPRISDLERILVQITYQSADDPSNEVVLRGRSDTDYNLGNIDRSRIFKRSRADRLRELQLQVLELSKYSD